jgi:hypothetical protein
MKFLALWFQPRGGAGPDATKLPELYKLFGEMANAGAMKDSGGWDPNAARTTVRAGSPAKTAAPADGDNVVGYLVIDAATEKDAQQWCTRWAGLAGDGRCELFAVPG